ncbi:MAG: DUF1150 family protein [Alphaproteobacteria bacterium]|jgi:hypothetical protein
MQEKPAASVFKGNVAEGHANLLAENLVYVRETPAAELVSSGLISSKVRLDPIQKYFVVCAVDGRPLAVLDNRELAFAAAREHDMQPVSVH